MANEYRVSQFAVEVLDDGAAAARVSSFAVEVLGDAVAKARVSSVALEALHNGTAAARVSSFSVEVLRSVADAPGPVALPHRGLSRFQLDEDEPWILARRRIGAIPAARRKPVLFTVC